MQYFSFALLTIIRNNLGALILQSLQVSHVQICQNISLLLWFFWCLSFHGIDHIYTVFMSLWFERMCCYYPLSLMCLKYFGKRPQKRLWFYLMVNFTTNNNLNLFLKLFFAVTFFWNFSFVLIMDLEIAISRFTS